MCILFIVALKGKLNLSFVPAFLLLEQETEARETESQRNIYTLSYWFFGHAIWLALSEFPYQGLNPAPSQWKHSPNHWTIRAVQEIYF